MIISLITPIADIISVVSLDLNSPGLLYVSNTIYYLCLQCTAFLFFLYCCVPLARREKITRIQMVCFLTPLVLVSLIILTNPLTDWLYHYDFETRVYSYSPLQFICYIPTVMYYLHAVYFVIRRRDVYNKRLRKVLLNISIIIVVTMIIQQCTPKLLLYSFAISLASLQLLVATIEQGITFDPETGMLSKNAFYDKINNLIYNKIPFNAITIRMADYEVVLSTYGISLLKELENAICHSLNGNIPENSGYKLGDDMWTIIYEYQSEQDNKAVEHMLDDILAHRCTINGLDISFSYFIVSFKFPEHFKSISEFMGLVAYLQKTHRMRYGIMPVEEFALRDLHREQDVEHAITDALLNNTFEVYYQPIYDTAINKFTSAEALIRLNNSAIGPVGPGEFIPIAEKTGQIIQIGDYVLKEVCKFLKENDTKALGIDYIEVNLSTIQCLQRNFIVSLESIVQEYGIDPSLLCFEITETASNCAPEIFHNNLNTLHELGFKLALDDFGTGYGNLQRLISMNFDYVKFDNYTTATACSDEKLKPLFPKLLNMIRSMNAQIVCEGVETQEQLDFLTELKVDYIQGYYFSRPINSDSYLNFLKENS